MNEAETISRKETYSGSMAVFIGLFYGMQAAGMYMYHAQKNLPHAFYHEGITALLFLFGGVQFLRQRTNGWVTVAFMLIYALPVTFRYIVSLVQSGGFPGYTFITISFFILLCLSVLFLFYRETRIKYAVNNKSYFLVIVMYLLVTYIF